MLIYWDGESSLLHGVMQVVNCTIACKYLASYYTAELYGHRKLLKKSVQNAEHESDLSNERCLNGPSGKMQNRAAAAKSRAAAAKNHPEAASGNA